MPVRKVNACMSQKPCISHDKFEVNLIFKLFKPGPVIFIKHGERPVPVVPKVYITCTIAIECLHFDNECYSFPLASKRVHITFRHQLVILVMEQLKWKMTGTMKK